MKIIKISSLNNSVASQKNQSKNKSQQTFAANMGTISKEAQEIFGASEKDILDFLAQPEHISKIKSIYSKTAPWSSVKIDIDAMHFKTETKKSHIIISANTDGKSILRGYTHLLIPPNFKITETPSFVSTLVEKMQKATDNIRL